MKTSSYKIGRIGEECQCEHCGYPMYIGDKVVVMADGQGEDDRPHCSRECCEQTRARDIQSYATSHSSY